MSKRGDNARAELASLMNNPFTTAITIRAAVSSLVPEADCTISEGDDGAFAIIEWVGPEGEEPTKSEIRAEHTRLQGVWAAKQYARDRRAVYPDWETQLGKIYDDGIDAWKTEMVDPVKAKIPKP